ncbi:MAG: VIT family protein [Burkholderiaceae bacterium]|nr:VIT family protein [Burkholderiaceae bacterium]
MPLLRRPHGERHRTSRIGWLRASVMGANDGIVSTASLLLGVAAAGTDRSGMLIAGVAGLVAGAMSMAAGEYVSVHAQADTETADLAREQAELDADADAELNELTAIYMRRGVEPELARQVATQLTARDALAAHARDELGISELLVARPLQAAGSSAASFAVGALLPLAVCLLAPPTQLVTVIWVAAIASLAFLGGLSAQVGGAGVWRSASRVALWGALAMGLTSLVGALFSP